MSARLRAAQLGMKVGCVEKRATLGGTCLNIGCIPSKALLQSSEEFDHTRHALADHGVLVDGVKLDLARMQARKAEVVTANVKGVEFLFRKNKVTWLKGTGRITAPGKVDVDGTVHETKNIVIATGSESVPLPGVDGGREADRHLHRRAGAGQSAGPPGGDRRRLYRAGTRQRVAPAGRRGDRGGIPRPHRAGHGRRGRHARSSASWQKQGIKFRLGTKVTAARDGQ